MSSRSWYSGYWWARGQVLRCRCSRQCLEDACRGSRSRWLNRGVRGRLGGRLRRARGRLSSRLNSMRRKEARGHQVMIVGQDFFPARHLIPLRLLGRLLISGPFIPLSLSPPLFRLIPLTAPLSSSRASLILPILLETQPASHAVPNLAQKPFLLHLLVRPVVTNRPRLRPNARGDWTLQCSNLVGAHELSWRCGRGAVVHGTFMEAARAERAAGFRPTHAVLLPPLSWSSS